METPTASPIIDTIRCLLVEDNPADAAVLQAQLANDASEPVEITWRLNLAAALEALAEREFDVVVLDLSLPDSDGLDTFISLHARAPQVPVVVLSGLGQPQTVNNAVRMGAQDFLIKNQFTPGTLGRSLRFAIERHRLVEQLHTEESTVALDRTSSDRLAAAVIAEAGVPSRGLSRAQRTDRGGGTTTSQRIAVTHTRFTLHGDLGKGGMGEVLLARQVNLDRDVAVKVLKNSHRDPQHVAQFQAEARVTAYLEHPNIIPVYDRGEHFFVMRRVTGLTLSRLLMSRERPTLSRLIEILIRVCDAVAFAHSLGIIHRDIKPGNIMVGEFGQTWLMDWGLALSVERGLGRSSVAPPVPSDRRQLCCGTLGYMPPEIADPDALKVGYGVDVFQLGATLFAILAGQPPVEGGDESACLSNAAHGRYRDLAKLAPMAPPMLAELCHRSLAIDPRHRGTASAFQDTLKAWLSPAVRPSTAEAWRGTGK